MHSLPTAIAANSDHRVLLGGIPPLIRTVLMEESCIMHYLVEGKKIVPSMAFFIQCTWLCSRKYHCVHSSNVSQPCIGIAKAQIQKQHILYLTGLAGGTSIISFPFKFLYAYNLLLWIAVKSRYISLMLKLVNTMGAFQLNYFVSQQIEITI